jgi:hypothetical protein
MPSAIRETFSPLAPRFTYSMSVPAANVRGAPSAPHRLD